MRKQIARAMETLPAMQRSTFVLVHLEGFTVTEASDILDIAVGTTKSHLHRALKRLRHELRHIKPNHLGGSI